MPYRLSYRPYRLPLRSPLRTANGVWAEREGLVIRLEDETGRVGFGEAAPIDWFGRETVAATISAAGEISGLVELAQIESVPTEFGALRFALAAALEGPGALPTGTRKLPVAALLPAGRPALAQLPARLEEGFLSFKWKVGVDRPEEELGILDDIIAALPGYAKLRLDANGGWDRRQAQIWLGRCADRPVEFVEQPLVPADRDGLLGLSRDFPVTLALDESVVSLPEARRWQADGWPGVFVIKPALCGPLAEMAAWIVATKADVVLSSAIETALGRRQIVARALAGDLTKRALGFGVGGVFGDRRWDGPVAGPWLDAGWCEGVNPEDLWNALN